MLAIIFFAALQPENLEINNVVAYPSVTALFFRLIFTLIFIILAVYLVLRLIKRQQSLQQNQKKWIKIFDYQALGANRGLYLVELDGLICIIAVSEGQINILKEIDPHTERWGEIKNDLLASEALLSKGMERLFKRKITSLTNKKNLTTGEFQQQLAEQLRRSQHLSHHLFQGRDKGE